MKAESYRTIQVASTGEYREKGSRFLAFAHPVSSEAEVKEHLQSLRKKYFDARHQGYAYRLGPEKKKFRAYDDGEPSHSTGDPILGQIKAMDLTDILIVVVRYFGGVRLGVGRLAMAYKTAAGEALKNAMIVEREVTVTLSIFFDYPATSDINRVIKEFDLDIVEREFSGSCHLVARVPLRRQHAALLRLSTLQATGVKVKLKEL